MLTTRPIREARPSADCAVGIGAAAGAPAPALGIFWRDHSVVRMHSAGALVAAAHTGKVGAAVRGTLPPADFLHHIGLLPGVHLSGRAVLLEPRPGLGVFLGPVGVAEGRGAKARTAFAADACAALSRFGLATEDPLVAVLSHGRDEDAARGPNVARSLRESAAVVKALSKRRIDAFHAGPALEDVLPGADVIVAQDGASGNLAFRALHLAGGMRSFGALVLGASRPFVDTSRRRDSYQDPLRFAAYLACAPQRA